MAVEMEYRLPCFCIGVNDKSVSSISDMFLLCDLPRNKEYVAKELAIIGGCIIECRYLFFWHDEDVHWRLRCDVAKRDDKIIFKKLQLQESPGG